MHWLSDRRYLNNALLSQAGRNGDTGRGSQEETALANFADHVLVVNLFSPGAVFGMVKLTTNRWRLEQNLQNRSGKEDPTTVFSTLRSSRRSLSHENWTTRS
jgi:hypothetical protein